MSAQVLAGIASIITAISGLVIGVLQITMLRRPPAPSDDSAPRSSPSSSSLSLLF